MSEIIYYKFIWRNFVRLKSTTTFWIDKRRNLQVNAASGRIGGICFLDGG